MTIHPATAEALEEILRVTAKDWGVENGQPIDQ
ncbi:hypothetical protein PEP31012_03560 [Pandoraea eparura]|uniref:Uncharacterized protein n=1 Tax=Pandoraea eparura TaxID=2508291 RepID=A0A5E4WY10_9BURK|nr:hypothetical protein PEP31012_03560 [Pandoraea eparura]